MDPWAIGPAERARHFDQFKSLNPVGGFVTGDQAKGFLLQSQLPPPVLGLIWSLADVNCDGKMDINEFSVACKLITMKLRGFEIPPTLPPALRLLIATGSTTGTPLMSPSGSLSGIASSPTGSLVGASVIPPSSGHSTPPQVPKAEDPWAITPQERARHQDQFKSLGPVGGFVTGEQVKGLMVQSQLPPQILGIIWNLSDVNCDGKMDINEFSVACKLITMKLRGFEIPATLPPVLKAVLTPATSASSTPILLSPSSGGPSFEDKRKENYDKGQAELDRRRKLLQDLQNREREERERKEREEHEKREKIRLEMERKKQEELEMKLAMQREMEERKMEEMRKSEEMKENARKEMERQRMQEMQETKRSELLQRRMKEQENLLKLKADNTNIGLELQGLTDKVRELGLKITETRVGVSGVKSEIDGMRNKRDEYIAEVTALKVKLKEQNARVLAAEREKARLDKLLVEKEVRGINLKQLREKLTTMKDELAKKQSDSELATEELTELKATLSVLIESCKSVYEDYKEKRDKIISMRKKHHQEFDYNAAWSTSGPPEVPTFDQTPVYYLALYDFESRNPDELSFIAGEIIQKNPDVLPDPGWLSGILDGRSGLFPESFVQEYDPNQVGVADTTTTEVQEAIIPAEVLPAEEDNYYVASYPYESTEPGDLAFQVGETVLVTQAEGEWWTGSIPGTDRSGMFPGSYVSKVDASALHSEDVNINTIPNTNSITDTPYHDDVDKAGDNIVGEQSKNELEPFEEAEIKREMSEITNQTVILKSPKPVKTGKRYDIATVLANYQPSSSAPGQLTLTRGMLVTVRKKSSSGWWEGELQAKGKKREIGWFPGSYVKVLGPGGSSSRGGSSRTTPIPFDDDYKMPDDSAPVFYENNEGSEQQQSRSNSAAGGISTSEQVIALFPYTAQNSDELSFSKDDVITVISKDEPDWYRGKLGTSIGLFPTNYVTTLQSEQEAFHHHQNNYGHNFHSQQIIPQNQPQYPPSPEPVPVFIETMGPEATKRQEAIKELLATEETYIEDMLIVKECFITPFQQSQFLSREELNTIFVNWDHLIESSKRLLSSFKIRWRNFGRLQIVGDLISAHIPSMQIYIRFCSCSHKGAALLQSKLSNSAFAKYVQKLNSNPKTQNLPLSSWLLKPMQRVTKYPLLINKILSNTSQDHPDRRGIEEAMAKAQELCNQVNEGVRETENSERLEWLQQNVIFDDENERIVFNSLTNCIGPRKILHQGHLRKCKSGKELFGFLFTDFLLLTAPTKSIGQINFSESNSSVKFKIYRKPIFLNELLLNELEDTQFTIDEMLLATEKIPEKTLWLKKIKEGKKSYEKIEKQFKSKQKSRGTFCGRLLVVVVEGLNLQNTNVQHGKGMRACGRLRVTIIQGNSLYHGKNNPHPYCEVSLGSEVKRTRVLRDTLNPKWNDSMQFSVRDLVGDILCISIYDKDLYSPNGFMGRTEIRIATIHEEMKTRKTPWTQKFKLQEIEGGEVVVKFHLQVFND